MDWKAQPLAYIRCTYEQLVPFCIDLFCPHNSCPLWYHVWLRNISDGCDGGSARFDKLNYYFGFHFIYFGEKLNKIINCPFVAVRFRCRCCSALMTYRWCATNGSCAWRNWRWSHCDPFSKWFRSRAYHYNRQAVHRICFDCANRNIDG